jgi:hypothetical protein
MPAVLAGRLEGAELLGSSDPGSTSGHREGEGKDGGLEGTKGHSSDGLET